MNILKKKRHGSKFDDLENKFREKKIKKEVRGNQDKSIILHSGKDIKIYERIETKLNKAKSFYDEFTRETNIKKKYNIIKSLIDLIEINSKYNYEFLKLNKLIEDYKTIDKNKNEKIQWAFQKKFNSLKDTLSIEDYKELYNQIQEDPINELNIIFQLIISKSEKEKNLKKKILNHIF